MKRRAIVAGACVLIVAAGGVAAWKLLPSTPHVSAARPPLAAGREFRDALASGGEGPLMRELPAGRFLQGSDESEDDREAHEGPLHEVAIAAFALGKYEVTRGEFRRFAEATGYVTDAERNLPVEQNDVSDGCFSFRWQAGTQWRDAGIPQDDTHPVVCVSWNDAAAYVAWLAQETGQAYRLPSESEFEYANRAGGTTAWPWGDDGDAGCEDANYADASLQARFPDLDVARCNDGHALTAPVGSRRANPFGLHDLAGNVWERLADCWNDSYQDAPADGRAWTSGGCSQRAIRGGSWGNISPRWLRSAVRGHADPASRTSDAGFRVARGPRPGSGG